MIARGQNNRQGFSIIEAVLASSILALIVSAVIGALIYGQQTTVTSGLRKRAVFLAEEGQEAVRNIRDDSFTNLTNGTHGLAISGNQWAFSGSQDVTDIFTRQIIISSLNPSTKIIESKVDWQQTGQRSGTVTLTSYLTTWQDPVGPAPGRGGMLVYGNGGTTTDAIQYRLLDGVSGTWGAAQATADIDVGSTNRALRVARVYSSATRNEKILVSRHFNGATQYIYGQVYNGASWGNVVLLASWSATTFLDVINFSGTYLANGDFMVVYADNTNIPKFQTWNGSSWSSQISLPNIGGIPNYIIAKARSGSNEVMAAFFDRSNDTNTAYFNGGVYATASWTLHAEHANAAPTNTKQHIDFDWSPNSPLVGGLAFANAGTDRSLTLKIWTANGTGGGGWSAAANTVNQASNLGATAIIGRIGANEFIACDKDAAASPSIICYRANFTPTWFNPINQTIVSGTDAGIQKSFDIGFETISDQFALNVFSNNSVTPQLKKYTTSTNTWDASASTLNNLNGSLETTRLIPQPDNDDIFILLADTTQRLYSIVWDGSTDAMYTSPAGKAFTSHGIAGSADTEFWFDFAWDRI